MRIAQRALALTLGGLLVASAAAAQTPPPSSSGQRGPGRMQAMLMQGITLTSAQQAKVDSIAAAYRALRPQMTPGTPPSEADRQKTRGLMMASIKDIRGVLTPEQQAVYDKNVTEMQKMMQQMQQGGGAPSTAPATGQPPQ